jgi:2EXR family
MSDSDYAQTTTESSAAALRNIGLSSRDLMAAINRLGSNLEILSLTPWDSSTASKSYHEADSERSVRDTFTSFGQLPSELRIKIWSYVCFQPRNIDIFTDKLGVIRISDDTYFDAYMFYSHFCSHPAVLHVCREAREEALKHYQLEFGTSYHFSLVDFSTPPRIYVNFACDRLCLLEPDCFGSDLEDRFQRFVQICRDRGACSLALNVARDQHWPFVDVATSWNALEELVLFGSVQNFEYLRVAGVSIDFVEPHGAGAHNKDEYREHAAVRQLEIARRDFLALFEMHNDGLRLDMSIENESTSTNAKEKLLWKAPAVEIRHLVIDGEQDSNYWAWGR